MCEVEDVDQTHNGIAIECEKLEVLVLITIPPAWSFTAKMTSSSVEPSWHTHSMQTNMTGVNSVCPATVTVKS